jgi:hypothetical protein
MAPYSVQPFEIEIENLIRIYPSIIPSPKLVRETPAVVASRFTFVWKFPRLVPLLTCPVLRAAKVLIGINP